MDVNTFYKKHHHNIKYEAKMIVKRYRVPSYLIEDCINAGYIHVCRYLPRWDSTRGANPMTYMVMGIRKEMNGVCRGHLHHQPYNYRVDAEKYVFELEEQFGYNVHEDTSDTCSLSFEEKLDINRVVQESLKTRYQATSHFLYSAFDRYAVMECAKDTGVTRQAVYLSTRKQSRRLREKLSAG